MLKHRGLGSHGQTISERLSQCRTEVLVANAAAHVFDGVGHAENDGLTHPFTQPLKETHCSCSRTRRPAAGRFTCTPRESTRVFGDIGHGLSRLDGNPRSAGIGLWAGCADEGIPAKRLELPPPAAAGSL